tara:strand:+ start:66 stop:671 length:606 start_codon:yes stop_codon:yes gene_type:complete
MSKFNSQNMPRKEGKEFKIVSADNHLARCYSLIDLGTQTYEYKGEVKEQRKVRITWELPNETDIFDGEEKPMIIGNKYTWSFSEKGNLRKMLESWRGQKFTKDEVNEFDEEKILGVPCLINVIHAKNSDGSRTYANIGSVSKVMKNMECPEQFNPSFCYSINDDGFEGEIWDALPEFMQNEIKESLEYKQLEEFNAPIDGN